MARRRVAAQRRAARTRRSNNYKANKDYLAQQRDRLKQRRVANTEANQKYLAQQRRRMQQKRLENVKKAKIVRANLYANINKAINYPNDKLKQWEEARGGKGTPIFAYGIYCGANWPLPEVREKKPDPKNLVDNNCSIHDPSPGWGSPGGPKDISKSDRQLIENMSSLGDVSKQDGAYAEFYRKATINYFTAKDILYNKPRIAIDNALNKLGEQAMKIWLKRRGLIYPNSPRNNAPTTNNPQTRVSTYVGPSLAWLDNKSLGKFSGSKSLIHVSRYNKAILTGG